jgi:predicted dehydrogenase
MMHSSFVQANFSQVSSSMFRREFMKSTGALALASFPWSSGLAATETKPIRVGQIGTRHAHAAGQLQTILALPEHFECVGVVEPDPARRQLLKDHPTYSRVSWINEEELLNTPDLQIVAVETEVRDLLATAQRCVEAGCHIHLDKPAGESLAELIRLHQTAEQNHLLIQMGYMYRYNPAFQFLFQAVDKGWLGDIFEIHGVMSKSVNNSTRKELAEYPGGSMFELGCHLIDPLLTLLGIPNRVTAHNRKSHPDQDDLLDNCLAVFDFDRATATVRSSLIEPDGGRRRQFVVCGTQGTIAIRPLEPPRLELTLAQDVEGHKKGHHTVAIPQAPGRYHGAWLDLANAITDRRPLRWSHAHDIAVQRAILIAGGYDVAGFDE